MRILLIPGIGDIHWVMLKMEAWIEQNCKGKKPEIWIWNFDNRPRSADFVKRIPFVKFGGYFNKPIELDRVRFHKSYMTGQYSEIKNFHGFDAYICVNGALRVGRQMSQILPKCKTNWDYEINLDGCESPIKEKYIIFYFSDHGMFTQWVSAMPPEKIKQFAKSIKGHRLILTGSSWDKPFNEGLSDSGLENWCGDTSLDELLGLIKGASAFIGWCGGNTIISQHLNTPTLMLWSNYFDKPFQTNWVKPEKIGSIYIPMNVESINHKEFLKNVDKLLSRKASLAF